MVQPKAVDISKPPEVRTVRLSSFMPVSHHIDTDWAAGHLTRGSEWADEIEHSMAVGRAQPR